MKKKHHRRPALPQGYQVLPHNRRAIQFAAYASALECAYQVSQTPLGELGIAALPMEAYKLFEDQLERERVRLASPRLCRETFLAAFQASWSEATAFIASCAPLSTSRAERSALFSPLVQEWLTRDP